MKREHLLDGGRFVLRDKIVIQKCEKPQGHDVKEYLQMAENSAKLLSLVFWTLIEMNIGHSGKKEDVEIT